MKASKDLLLKTIDEILFLQDEKPLLKGEKIDLNAFSLKLQEILNQDSLQIAFQKMSWEKDNDILKPFGHDPYQICLNLTPLVGSCYWITGQAELNELAQIAFSRNPTGLKNLSLALKEGFYHYFALASLSLFQNEPLFQGLNFKIIEKVKIQSPTALCIDFNITVNKKTFTARLALTPDFRISWNRHHRQMSSIFFSDMKESLQLPLSFILAKTTFTPEELKTIQTGDFLLLDKVYFDPKTNIDNVLIQLYSIPLFQAKLKKEKLQIIDFAHLEENIMPEEKKTKRPSTAVSKEAEMPPIETESEQESVSIKSLPINMTIELAKMQMPLSEMTALQPGNFLELPSSVEEGVDLCVNGKRIGRGELVHLGEKIGVRVLEIG